VVTELVAGAEVDGGSPVYVVGLEVPGPARRADRVAGAVRRPEHRRHGHGEQ
jgi:hypothetical protein